MSSGITFAKIVVMSGLLAVVLVATPAMNAWREYDVWPEATARKQLTPARPTPQVAAKPLPRVRARASSRPSRLARSAAGPEQKVRAILLAPLTQSGLELIPAASIIHGKVLDVVPASRWQPRGRIVIGFYFIEHAGTRSRESIATQSLIF